MLDRMHERASTKVPPMISLTDVSSIRIVGKRLSKYLKSRRDEGVKKRTARLHRENVRVVEGEWQRNSATN